MECCGWRTGLERLHRQPLIESFDGFLAEPGWTGLGRWEPRGSSLHGQAVIPLSTVLLPHKAKNFHLTCQLTALDCRRAALLLRVDDEGQRGLALTFDYELNRVELGPARRSWMTGFICGVDDYARGVLPSQGRPCLVRILMRDDHVEAYLDERGRNLCCLITTGFQLARSVSLTPPAG
jgi:hypothetical protein